MYKGSDGHSSRGPRFSRFQGCTPKEILVTERSLERKLAAINTDPLIRQ